MYENENYFESDLLSKPKEAFNNDNNFYGESSKAAEVKSQVTADDGNEKTKKKSHTLRKFVLSVSMGLCFGLFAGLGFYAVQLGTGQLVQQEEIREEDPDQIEEASSGSITVVDPFSAQEPTSVDVSVTTMINASEVVKAVMPAMVSIVNNYPDTINFWGQIYTPSPSSGSGIIVAEKEDELLIVTNNHVVEGTETLVVTFIDGSEAEAAIKGLDGDRDLAVIAVQLSSLAKDTKDAITIAALGDSDALELGEPVIAIGNALGYGQSVSGGMVSALGREITMDDGSTGVFIQTDAAINPGNSGGALLNLKGEVVGINSSKIGGTYVEGMGYAIPITTASPIIAELMERQTRTVKVDENERGFLGISPQNINDQISQMYGMPQGVFVYSVESGSAAAEAGMLRGDIIVNLDGQKISSADELLKVMEYYRAGETITLTVKRAINGEYESIEMEITLGKRP